MSLLTVFQSLVIWWRMGQIPGKLAQFVGHRRLLNLFFGSSGVVWCSKTKFTLGLRVVVYVPIIKFILG